MAVGQDSLYTLTTGTGNAVLGTAAARGMTTGNYNVVVGQEALKSNTTGSNNTAVGYQALYANTTGPQLTAVGYQALSSNTTAGYSAALGYRAGYNETSGSYNTFLGTQSGLDLTTGAGNTVVGSFTGQNMTSGSANTFVGGLVVGSSNGCASAMTTGSKNTIIGGYTGNQGGVNISTLSNNIVLSDGDGNSRLYYLQGSLTWFSPAIRDKTTASAANMRIDATSGAMFRSTSSLRYKNTVKDATHGLTELLSLRPVTYKGNNDGDEVFGGLIAEEVHDAGLTEFVQYDDQNRPDALAYGNMVSLCIKAIQEQQATIEALEARITALENA